MVKNFALEGVMAKYWFFNTYSMRQKKNTSHFTTDNVQFRSPLSFRLGLVLFLNFGFAVCFVSVVSLCLPAASYQGPWLTQLTFAAVARAYHSSAGFIATAITNTGKRRK